MCFVKQTDLRPTEEEDQIQHGAYFFAQQQFSSFFSEKIKL